MICQMFLSKLLKLLNCNSSHDCISVSLAPNSGNCPLAPNSGNRPLVTNSGNCPLVTNSGNRPLAPNSGGTRKIRKFFQSPPELGDLGGLNTLKRRQKNLQSKLATQ